MTNLWTVSTSYYFLFYQTQHTYETSYNFPQLSNLILIVFLFNFCLSVSFLLKQSSRKVLYHQLFKLIRLLDLDNVIRILKVLSFLLFNALCGFFDFYYLELIFSLRFNLYLDDAKDIILVFVFHFCFIVLVSEILLLYPLRLLNYKRSSLNTIL